MWYRREWNYHFLGVATWIFVNELDIGTRNNENWNFCASSFTCDSKLRLKFLLPRECAFSDLNKLSHYTYTVSNVSDIFNILDNSLLSLIIICHSAAAVSKSESVYNVPTYKPFYNIRNIYLDDFISIFYRETKPWHKCNHKCAYSTYIIILCIFYLLKTYTRKFNWKHHQCALLR